MEDSAWHIPCVDESLPSSSCLPSSTFYPSPLNLSSGWLLFCFHFSQLSLFCCCLPRCARPTPMVTDKGGSSFVWVCWRSPAASVQKGSSAPLPACCSLAGALRLQAVFCSCLFFALWGYRESWTRLSNQTEL